MAKARTGAKERKNPRFSVNSLSEYLVANAVRRRRILEEQKRPRDFQVSYYKEASEAIVECIASDMDLERLTEARNALSSSPPGNEWEASRRAAGIEAVEAFRHAVKQLDLSAYQIFRGQRTPRRLNLAGVSVSVRPEILLKQNRDGSVEAGGLKLFLSKNKRLAEDRARYIGTILYQYLRAQAKERAAVKYKHCYVIDVFGAQVFTAPRTYKRRAREVEASCEEISMLWGFV